ncbi:fibrinogen-like protein A, partial [Gigantopelta aegis]|uniref:fibrinogen-like protein A n=1 Tax=Gigantopelta aegis TaxID=1735272 RepID=UPI001B888290
TNTYHHVNNTYHHVNNTYYHDTNTYHHDATTSRTDYRLLGCEARQNQSSDGTYTIDSPGGGQVDVRCDMTTDNGGWLTFVRRVQGGVDFYRSWEDYKNGFGKLKGDFWLGNELLHKFTAAKDVEMRVDMWDWEGNHAYALYDSLHVDDEANKYTIHVGNYSGDAGDGFRRTP